MSRYSSRDYDDRFPPYVPVAQRARDAAAAVAKLKKKGHTIDPVVAISGRAIATTFWGKAWCAHLELLSDYRNRLPRGRSYVRRGAVIHLALSAGRIVAKVQGSSLYDIEIEIGTLPSQRWNKVVAQCTGNIDSLVELLRGKLSDNVLRAVTNAETGLFPRASEIRTSCSCADWAGLCKHLAAVLYGVGARLDTRPELLFTLRGVDASELVAAPAASAIAAGKTVGESSRRVLPSSSLSDVFGIEFEAAVDPIAAAGAESAKPTKRAAAKKGAAAAKKGAAAAKKGGAPKKRAAVKKSAGPKPTVRSRP